MIHILKTVSPYFDEVWARTKTAELRRNDRNFKLGDQLLLVHYMPDQQAFLNRWVLVTVTNMLSHGTYLAEGIVMLSFRVEGFGVDAKWVREFVGANQQGRPDFHLTTQQLRTLTISR